MFHFWEYIIILENILKK